MSGSPRNLVLSIAAAAVLAGLGAGAWWLARTGPAQAPAVEGGPARELSVPAPPPPAVEAPRVELVQDDEPAYATLETTVVFPLEVELQLVRAAATPTAEGAPRLGTGATAKLAGSVRDASGKGVRAEVRFVAGANAGRVLYADAVGQFGSEGLYPGLAVVKISAPGTLGAQREVRLRPKRETQLNVSFGRPARVSAEVLDGGGKPLAGARVTIDGQEATSGEDGVVDFAAVAAGEVLVLVEKTGFASLRQSLNLPVGGDIGRDKLKFRLDPGASLQIQVVESLNSGQQALAFLLPEIAEAERRFPWQSVNPVRVWPGGVARVDDLPRGRVTVRLYHAGALAKPARRSVELAPGARETVEFHLEAAPVVAGSVRESDGPAAGAIVRMEAPDRVQAMLSVFGETNYLFLESDVLPDLPPAVQETRANERGEFQLSACEDVSPVRYLTAVSPDGKRVAHAVLRPGTQRADLVLLPVEGGDGELEIGMEGRWQPLPVAVTVDGAPRDPLLLPPGRDLRIGKLPEGTWHVSVRWNGMALLTSQQIEIGRETSLSVTLPEGAIAGQDADTRRRAGFR